MLFWDMMSCSWVQLYHCFQRKLPPYTFGVKFVLHFVFLTRECHVLYIHRSRLHSTYTPASLSSWPGSPSPTTRSRHAVAALVSWKNSPALQFHACNPNHKSLVKNKEKLFLCMPLMQIGEWRHRSMHS
jgi:hypothetical protein